MENEVEITFGWENNVGFRMVTKCNAEESITVLAIDENGCIPTLWGKYQDICEHVTRDILNKIGEEMKVE